MHVPLLSEMTCTRRVAQVRLRGGCDLVVHIHRGSPLRCSGGTEGCAPKRASAWWRRCSWSALAWGYQMIEWPGLPRAADEP